MSSAIEMITVSEMEEFGGATKILHKNQQHDNITYLFICHDYPILVFNNTLSEVIINLGFLAPVGRKGKS